MNKMITQLYAAGLSEKEAQVYHASLLLGPTTVVKLARQTGLKRATIYAIIDALKSHGLMRIEEVGFKRVFVAESPQHLKRMIEKKVESVRTVIPELEELHMKSGKESIIRAHEGIAALENINQKLMDQAKSGDYRYFIGGDSGWKDLEPRLQQRYIKWRTQINLDVKLIFCESDRAKLHGQLAKALDHDMRVLPRDMKLKADIIITPRMLVIAKLSPPLSAIVIEDRDIIDTYYNLFLFMWENADSDTTNRA